MREALSALAVVALGTAALFWGTDGFRAITAEKARRIAVAERPREVPDVRLQRRSGETVRLSALRGRLVVATFIYTRCADVCPLLSLRMKRMREALPEAALGTQVRLLTVSFDPAHDTPARLAAYGERFGADPGEWWMTRPRGGLERLLETFGVVVLPDGEGGFRHNAAFYLVDRRQRLVAIFPDDEPERVVNAVEARL